MLEEARAYIENALENGVIGSNDACEYYPCHFEGQDCTWCFCPFYPCQDDLTNGKFVTSEKGGGEVWSCIDCRWVHREGVSKEVLKRIRMLDNWEKEIDKNRVSTIRVEILGSEI